MLSVLSSIQECLLCSFVQGRHEEVDTGRRSFFVQVRPFSAQLISIFDFAQPHVSMQHAPGYVSAVAQTCRVCLAVVLSAPEYEIFPNKSAMGENEQES